jgi:dihydrofolate synthase/folylpolyglutamate synthase
VQLGVDILLARRQLSATGSTVDLATPWGIHRAVPINLLGAHQTRNAALALAAAQAFLESPIDTAAVHHALGAVHPNGRAEVLRSAEPVIIVDGAHNRAAARALRDTLDECFPTPKRRVLVCAASGSRDPSEFLGGIGVEDFDFVIATQVYSTSSVSAESVAAAARRSGTPAMTNPDVGMALRNAVTSAGPDGLVVVAGSLYLVAPARDGVAALARPKTEVTEHES